MVLSTASPDLSTELRNKPEHFGGWHPTKIKFLWRDSVGFNLRALSGTKILTARQARWLLLFIDAYFAGKCAKPPFFPRARRWISEWLNFYYQARFNLQYSVAFWESPGLELETLNINPCDHRGHEYHSMWPESLKASLHMVIKDSEYQSTWS